MEDRQQLLQNYNALLAIASAQMQLGRIEKYKQSFLQFIKDYLSHHFYCEFSDFHYELINTLQDLDNLEETLFICPRGHGKTSIISFAFPLWLICTRRFNYILLISDTATQSKGNLQNIISELEYNDKLREDFTIEPARDRFNKFVQYTDYDIILNNNIKISARGTGQKLRGMLYKKFRPQIIISDDIENDEHVLTKQQRDKSWKWFSHVLNYIGTVRVTKKFVSGTILHFDSLLNRLFIEDNGWKKIKYEAIMDGKPLWSARWTMELLEKERAKDPKAFEMEFMNNPIVEEERCFFSDRFYYFDMSSIDIVYLDKILMVDPSMGEKTKSDYTCLMVLGKDDEANIFVLSCQLIRIDPTKLVDLVIDTAIEWDCLFIGFESNVFAGAIPNFITEKMSNRDVSIPIRKVITSANKNLKIASIAPLTNSGKIKFRSDYKKVYPKAIEQFDFFPSGDHDDAPDTLAMGVELLKFPIYSTTNVTM